MKVHTELAAFAEMQNLATVFWRIYNDQLVAPTLRDFGWAAHAIWWRRRRQNIFKIHIRVLTLVIHVKIIRRLVKSQLMVFCVPGGKLLARQSRMIRPTRLSARRPIGNTMPFIIKAVCMRNSLMDWLGSEILIGSIAYAANGVINI